MMIKKMVMMIMLMIITNIMLKINSYLVCKKIKQKTNNLYVFLIHKTENYKTKEPKKELIVQKQK